MPATLRLGSSGPDVLRWQRLLTGAGFPTPETSAFDQPTDAQTKAWQTSRGLQADGVVGPASWEAMVGAPPDPDAAYCRAALVAAWPRITGAEPNLAEIQIAAANAKLESGCGKASYTNRVTGERAQINNWGAVQRGPPPCGPDGFEATDTHADGTEYQFCYARYPTPEAGAAEMVRQMTVRRPTSWEYMRRGDIDSWAAAMREKDPVTGVFGYFEQSAEGRARGIDQRVRAIAAAFGEPVAATRGGPPPEGGVPPGETEGGGGVGRRLAPGLLVLGLGLGGLAAAEIVRPGALRAGWGVLARAARRLRR